jgi:hypothetical protein
MDFKDKYSTADLQAKDVNEKAKVTLSNDAYALGEQLNNVAALIRSFIK